MGNCVELLRERHRHGRQLEIKYQNDDELANADEKNVQFDTYEFKKARVVSVYDGDTFTVIANHRGKLTKFQIRLMEVNTPEIKGGTIETKQKAQEAKKFVEDAILGKIVNINVIENRIIDGKRVYEPFDRLLAYVYVDGKSLSKTLIDRGLGVPFEHKKCKPRNNGDSDSE